MIKIYLFFSNLDPGIENGTRLFGHYDARVGVTQDECFLSCKHSPKCLASTYNVNTRTCYLSDKFTKKTEVGWNSYVKKPQSKIAPAPAQRPVDSFKGIYI